MISQLLIAALAQVPTTLPPASLAARDMIGPASLEVEQDPITGTTSAFAVLRGSNEARLLVGCDRDSFRGLKVRLRSPAWFAPENLFTERTWVQFRFDEAQPRRSRWRAEDGALSIGSRRRVRNFTEWLMASNRLAIRSEDVEGRELDYLFATGAARPVLLQMYRICVGA